MQPSKIVFTKPKSVKDRLFIMLMGLTTIVDGLVLFLSLGSVASDFTFPVAIRRLKALELDPYLLKE